MKTRLGNEAYIKRYYTRNGKGGQYDICLWVLESYSQYHCKSYRLSRAIKHQA